MSNKNGSVMNNMPVPRTYAEAVKLDNALRRESNAGRTVLRVVLAGNANLDFLAPAVRVGLAAEGFEVIVRSSAYGNWISETFDDLDATNDDFWIVWLSGMGISRGMTERPEVDIAGTTAAAERLIARGVKVVLVPPEPLLVEDDPFSPFIAWRRGIAERLSAALPPAVVQLSLEHIVRRMGTDSWVATRYWEQAKAPCHPDAATAVGSELATVIARMMRPAVRAVAVDLDDTLWGGLVGEVGSEGLDLDPDGTGRPFIELQRLLLDLIDRGIPLAVVSKNDDAVARRPFSERPEMLLSLDSFVRFEASWGPKYEVIIDLAKQLNIGVDAICFLDDSPKERDEARRMLPGLIVPELPESPAKRVEHLLQSKLFMAPVVSDEDRLRVEFFKHSAAPAPANLDEYMSSLEMTLDAMRIDASNMERSLSLLHKTNQFNLTLWRPSPADLAKFVNDPSHYAYAFRLKDKVVDAGIIAVLLAKEESTRVELAAWVLSCRVFNRGVEWAIAQHLAAWVRQCGGASVAAPFTSGPRNALITKVLTSIGFESCETSDSVMWFSTERLTPPQHYIEIVEK
jgi:FkbH-like protein